MASAIERELRPSHIEADGQPTDIWVVWFVRVHGIFAIVALGLAVAAWFAGIGPIQAPVVGVLLLALAAWTWLAFFREPRFSRIRPSLFLAVALPVSIALGVAWPATMMLLFLTYWQIYSLLRLRAAVVTTAIFTVANIWAQQGFPARFPIESGAGAGFLLAAVGFGGVFAWFIGATIRQSIERRELIDELRRTQANLAASEREQGMLAERQRMAGDVHDTIAQEFTSILMSLEVARTRLGATPHDAGAYLDLARDAARHGLGESRRIVHAMRPELLTGRTLPDALETLANHWSQQTAVALSFTIDGEPTPIGRVSGCLGIHRKPFLV